MKGGANGAESAPLGVFWGAVYRVNTRAAMVRFGAAVVRVGAGQAHQGADAKNEQRHSKRVLLAVFRRVLAVIRGQWHSKSCFLAKMSKCEQMGTL